MFHKTKNEGGSLKPFFILHIFIVLSFFNYQGQSYTSQSSNSEKESFQDLILEQFSNSVNTELHARFPLAIEDLQELPGIGFNAFLNYPGDIGALTSDFVIDNYNLSDPRLQSIIRSFKPTHLRFNGGTPSNSMHNYSTLITRTNSASSSGQNNLTEHYFVEIGDIPQPTSPDLDYFVYREGSFFELRDFMKREAAFPDQVVEMPIDLNPDQVYLNLIAGLDNPAIILRRLSTEFAEGNQTVYGPDVGIYNTPIKNYLADFIDITMKDNISPVYVLKMFDPMNFVMDASIDGEPTNIQVSPILINRLGFTNYTTADQGLQVNFQLVRDRIKLDAKKEVRRQLIKYAYEYISHLSSTTVPSATFNAYMDDVENDALWSTNVSDMQANFAAEFAQIDELDISFELGNELYTWWYYKFLPSNIFEYEDDEWTITGEKRTNADLYAEICVEAIASITTMFTEAKFGVVGSNRENNHGGCVWMDELESNADLMALDFAYILHYYARYTADIDPSNALDPDNDDIPFILGEDNQKRVAEPVNHFFSRLDADDTGTDYLNQKSVWITESNTRELNEANTLIKETWFDLISKLNLMNQYLMRNSGDLSDLNSSAITNAGGLYNSSETAHLNIDILLSHTLYSNENNTALSITDNLDDPYNFWDLGLMHTIIGRLTENGNKSALPIVFTESPTATAIENTRFISPEGFHNGNQCHDGNGTFSDLLTNSPLVWGWQMLSDESSDCKSFKYLLVNSSNEECTLQGIDDYSEDNLDMFLFDFDGYSGTLTDLEITGNVIANIQDPDVFGEFLTDGNLIYFTSSIDNLPDELDFTDGIEMPPYSIIVLEGDPQSPSISADLNNYFNFNEPTTYSVASGENISFNGEDFDVLSNIEIAYNGILTINNSSVLRFAKDAGIIIQPGGRLNIEGDALLTSLNCNRLWQGITALGDAENTSQLSMNQASVIIDGPATIENAHIGIRLGTENQTVDAGVYTGGDGGAWVEATDALFRNNVQDIDQVSYRRFNGGSEVANRTQFDNCTFITDRCPLLEGEEPFIHVDLFGTLMGVDNEGTTENEAAFVNCSFLNTTGEAMEEIGIRAICTTYEVFGENDPYNPDVDNTHGAFHGLHCGVLHEGFGADDFTIRQMEFSENNRGLFALTSQVNSHLLNNNFHLPQKTQWNEFDVGAWILDCNGFEIQENHFFGYENSLDPHGLILDNCGPDENLARRNFYDNLFIGTVVFGDNGDFDSQSGLQNKCSSYTNNETDIYLEGEWKGVQGSPIGLISPSNSNQLTNNVFSSAISPCDATHRDFQIVTYTGTGGQFTYNMFNDPITDPDCDEDFRNEEFPFGSDPFNFEIECIAEFLFQEGEDLTGNKWDWIQNIEELQNALTILEVNVDGGDAEDIEQKILDTYQYTSQFVRDLMLQNYPLSDDVMREAIMNASRFDAWHLTQVLLSNAPLTLELTAFLEDSQVLSPFFMAFIYNANESGNNNLRSLLEQEVAYRSFQAYLARQNVFASIKDLGGQTSFIDWEDALLEEENDKARSALIGFHLQSDVNEAIALIQDVEDIKLRDTWATVLTTWEELSETEELELWDSYYANESDYGLALAALNKHSNHIIWPIYTPIPLENRSMSESSPSIRFEQEENFLQIFPNPASDIAYLTYNSDLEKDGLMTIFDMQGRLITSVKTNNNGITEINTKEWTKGVYMVNLNYKGYSIESVSLVKQ